MLKTGINWEDLPREMGCGSGMTGWRRPASWTAAGVWPKLHALLLSELEWAGAIDWSRATIDGSHVRARGGGEATGPSPVDRRKKGSKHVVVTDSAGLPLAAVTAPGNRPDVAQLERAGRRRAAGPRPARPPAAAAGGDVRRPRLRLEGEPRRPATTRRPPEDRPDPDAALVAMDRPSIAEQLPTARDGAYRRMSDMHLATARALARL